MTRLKSTKHGTVYTKTFYLLFISFHSESFPAFRDDSFLKFKFKLYGFSFHMLGAGHPSPPPVLWTLLHPGTSPESSLRTVFLVAFLPSSHFLPWPTARAAPAGRVSIGDILAGPSVALPPLHPVTHVRLAALPVTRPLPPGRSPARRPSGLQAPDPSW